jgi:hypothetical protein
MVLSQSIGRRVQFTAKRYCGKCGSTGDQVYSAGRIEPGSRPDETFVKVESWCCESCETVAENRREGSWPTDKSKAVRRLLRLSTDYDQVRESSLQVEGDIVALKLRFYPWAVVKASRRVEEAENHGFYRLSDLLMLERNRLLKEQLRESVRMLLKG